MSDKTYYYRVENAIDYNADDKIHEALDESIHSEPHYAEAIEIAKSCDKGSKPYIETIIKPKNMPEEELIINQDETHLLVLDTQYNTFEVYRKLTEDEVKNAIREAGAWSVEQNGSDDIKDLAKDTFREDFSIKFDRWLNANNRDAIMEFDNADATFYYFRYNAEKDAIEFGDITNAGFKTEESIPVDYDLGVNANLEAAKEKMEELHPELTPSGGLHM